MNPRIKEEYLQELMSNPTLDPLQKFLRIGNRYSPAGLLINLYLDHTSNGRWIRGTYGFMPDVYYYTGEGYNSYCLIPTHVAIWANIHYERRKPYHRIIIDGIDVIDFLVEFPVKTLISMIRQYESQRNS